MHRALLSFKLNKNEALAHDESIMEWNMDSCVKNTEIIFQENNFLGVQKIEVRATLPLSIRPKLHTCCKLKTRPFRAPKGLVG